MTALLFVEEDHSDNEEMPRKKRKKGVLGEVLGHIDMNSKEAKKVLKAKSKNAGAVRLVSCLQYIILSNFKCEYSSNFLKHYCTRNIHSTLHTIFDI